MDPRKILNPNGSRPNQSELQDARRRANQRPAISRAQRDATDGVNRGSAAQQRADEAHSRFTNGALDAAHTRADAAHSRSTNSAIHAAHSKADDAHSRLTNPGLNTAHQRADEAHNRNTNAGLDAAHKEAEAAYPKTGAQPASRFNCNVALGGAAQAILGHSPSDGDDIVLIHGANNSVFFKNQTTGNTLLVMDRGGNMIVPSGSLLLTGGVDADGGLVPNFIGAPVSISGGQSATYDHNFGKFPQKVETWCVHSSGLRTPLPAFNIIVEWYSTTQIKIANTAAAGTNGRTIGCFLFK